MTGDPVSKMAFAHVTELSGAPISRSQLRRMVQRYRWAADYCQDRDVVEVACGAGQGLGLLLKAARRLEAGDVDPQVLAIARRTYGDRVPLRVFDAIDLPFGDSTLDVIVLFEALYYVAAVDGFVAECRRVLRPGGTVLVATANRDLYDFTPSPMAHRYFNAAELHDLFEAHGFDNRFYGGSAVAATGLVYGVLRPLKALATRFNLMPRTMIGKQLLKRLVFGRLVEMPAELVGYEDRYEAPIEIKAIPDFEHQVLYCAATRRA